MVIRYSVPIGWYDGFYQDDKAPCKAGRSFSILYRDVKAETAVLLIHGYTGYPGELVRPARDLYEKGFDVYVPRLPGHGTNRKNFLKTSEKDWIGVAENAARDLAKKYKNLYVVGHSMGGGIALIVTERVKEVKRLVAACPACASDDRELPAKIWQLKLLSVFKKVLPNAWQSDPEYVMYYEDAPKDDGYLGGEYWSHLFPRQLVSLFKIMLESGKAIKNINVPILAIGSRNDKILGLKSVELIKKSNPENTEMLTLEEATHYLFYDKNKDEEEKAVKAILEFLS